MKIFRHRAHRLDDLSNLITNVQSPQQYRDHLKDVAHEISARLSLHCGPFATNAVIPISAGDGKQFDQYTKDGISIVQAMLTDDVLSQYMLRLVAHVGKSVDTVCHDGTTTSMMLFASLVDELMGVLQIEDNDIYTKEIGDQIKLIVDRFKQVITQNTVTVESLYQIFAETTIPGWTQDRVKYAFAYHQAYIASKGDHELSRGIADVLTSLPVESYGQYIIKQQQIESEDRFLVETKEHDFDLNGQLAIASQRNHKMGTELYVQDADLLFCGRAMIIGSPTFHAVMSYISTGYEGREDYGWDPNEVFVTKPLVIICPEFPPVLIGAVNQHNRDHPQATIYLLNHYEHVLIQDVIANVIAAMATKTNIDHIPFEDPKDCFIPHVSVRQRNNKIFIYNLYEKTNETFHPSYVNKERNLFYTTTLNEIQEMIENATKRHVETLGDREVNKLITYYRCMTCQTIKDLILCGTTHEVVANRSVVEDAFGAAVSALSDGVILGGYTRLLGDLVASLPSVSENIPLPSWVYRLMHRPIPSLSSIEYDVKHAFINALFRVINAIYRYTDEDVTLKDLFVLTDHTEHHTKRFDCLSYLLPGCVDRSDQPIQKLNLADGLSTFLACENDSRQFTVLLQPVRGYYEQFLRMKDILPKLINSSCFVDHFRKA